MSSGRENLLLAVLPADETARLRPHLEQVHLRRGQVIESSEGLVRWVYFSEGAILAVTVSMEDGTTIEAGMIEKGRGWIKIIDRRALERATCECYWSVRDEWEHLLAALKASSPRISSSASPRSELIHP